MTADRAAAPPPAGSDGVVAIGWATVELDRAAAELSELVGPGPGFVDARDSEALGARCRRASAAGSDGVSIVLLEPSTEGRLAAALARHGEGWVATWFVAPTVVSDPTAWSSTRPGPLGLERLARDAPVTGPFRLAVDGDTIEP